MILIKLAFMNLCLVLMSSYGTTISDKSEIENIRKQTDFNIYLPSIFETASNFEIKEPYDINQIKEVKMLMINYFDSKGSYVFGVTQLRNNSYITKEITEINVENKTEETRRITQKFVFEPRGELVTINGNNGWYEAYIGVNATGGMLKWIESDTYIELDTKQLSKSSLIKIAESMNEI